MEKKKRIRQQVGIVVASTAHLDLIKRVAMLKSPTAVFRIIWVIFKYPHYKIIYSYHILFFALI